ncbi:HCP-like protein [Backusella circina FSU 941]|nr:HCP-like protein [Backusella circina FSU 941]
MARVWVAQCKIHGFHVQKNVAAGFRELYELAEIDHHPEAYYPLGLCYYEGWVPPYYRPQYDMAFDLFCRVSGYSHQAQYRAGLMLTLGQGVETDTEKALVYISASAHRGNQYAQFTLGLYYEYGLFVPHINIKEAWSWYELSAHQGFSEAQTALANILLDQLKQGAVESKLLKDGLYWLHQAADQKNPSALIRLGSLHEQGTLVEQDFSKSIQYYQKATEVPSGSATVTALAHYLVGINYRLGNLGLERDDAVARKHFQVASDLDYAPAQRALGLMYAQGEGVIKDENKAYSLFEKAATKGDVRSLGLMAHQLEHQEGCKINIDLALSLYKKAAETGSVATQLALAELLQRKGHHTQAFKWFIRAANETQSVNSKGVSSILDLNISLLQQRHAACLMIARYRFNGWGGIEKDPSWAFQEIKRLALDENYTEAYYWLAACFEEGIENGILMPDAGQAFEYYEIAALSGDLESQFQVAYMLSNGYWKNTGGEGKLTKDRETAFTWYSQAADRGHKTAQYSVGLYYEKGLLPVQKDLIKAKDWYERAAIQDMTIAMIALGCLVIDEKSDALFWFKKAADKGDVSALREMAWAYENKWNEPENAFKLYQQAAEKDDAVAWQTLSHFYELGLAGQEIDIDMAIHCLEKANRLGYTRAALYLAELYRKQDMVEEAFAIYKELEQIHTSDTTIGWLARLEKVKFIIYKLNSSSVEHKMAYHALCNMSRVKNRIRAEAMEIIGYCNEQGIGTEKNLDTAIDWYKQCIANSNSCELHSIRSTCKLITIFMDLKQYTQAYICINDLKPILDDLSRLSDEGFQQARRVCYFLGYLLFHGLGTTKQAEEGLGYLKTASEQGEGDAAFQLGLYYQSTENEEAVLQFYQGVMANHPGCIREWALSLLSENDYCMLDHDTWRKGASVLNWLEIAVSLGDVESIYQTAVIYETGFKSVFSGNTKDITKAKEYHLKGAMEGHPLCMLKTAEWLGGFNQYNESIEWLQKAAARNMLKAHIILLSYDLQGLTGGVKGLEDVYFRKLEIVLQDNNMKSEPVTLTNRRSQESKIESDKEGRGLGWYLLGQCHELGKGTSISIEIAKECYKKAVETSSHINAMWRLGVIYSLEEDDQEALFWLCKASELGNHSHSLYQLGLYHLYGKVGLEPNPAVAKKYFTKAADQGHPQATFELARILWSQSQHELLIAYQMYQSAADAKVPEALRELGYLSHTGFSFRGIHIVKQDYRRAFGYFCEAAQFGDPTAALMVGNYFEEGYLSDIGQDWDRALQWYESAYHLNCGGLAELAIGKLKHTIANTMLDQRQAEDLREEAFVWFESAADDVSNNVQRATAKVMVALYHINGWGRKSQNRELGFQLLLEIAKSEESEAFIPIAKCYEFGIGTHRDMIMAAEYWDMAADMDDPEALIRMGQIYEHGLLEEANQTVSNDYYERANQVGKISPRSGQESINSSSSSASSLFSTQTPISSIN